MKTTKIILVFIFLSIMLLPNQIGQIQSYDKLFNLKTSDPINSLDQSIKTNRQSISSTSNSVAPELQPQTASCHFGMTAPNGVTGYDLSILGIESYLDWGKNQKNSTVADNIQYYRVINVSNSSYDENLRVLPDLLSAYPGSVWIIGNEPDSEVTYQDNISAETYAERFHAMAKLIRLNDLTAKIAFGSVIQPTPVRLYYLTKTIDRLTQLENGNLANALSLIDIYSIHSFILNEEPLYDINGINISWGAGVPVGYDPHTWPPYQVISVDQTYDINLFVSHVFDFRKWMKELGEQSKPLWITEYGSLIPPPDVSELVTAEFMEQTFDFMLETKDPSLGFINDDNRLVQKWLWYSLNDKLNHFGGSLYNPQNHELTTVGAHFINYNPPLSSVPATNPDVYIDSSNPTVAPGPPGYYKISIKVSNTVSSDRLTGVRVDLFHDGTKVGTVETNLPRCSGIIPVSFNVNNLLAGDSYTFTAQVSLISTSETDIDPSNNEMVFQPITMPIIYNLMMPLLFR